MADSDLAEYQRALRVWERMLAMEMDALQRSNLLRRIGDGCLEIIEQRNCPEVCRRAIDAYEEALQFYSAESYPALRARVLRGLGSAYSSLPTSQKGVAAWPGPYPAGKRLWAFLLRPLFRRIMLPSRMN